MKFLPLLLAGTALLSAQAPPSAPELAVSRIAVDGREHRPGADGILVLPPGGHRLDCTLAIRGAAAPMRIRATMEGLEEEWRDVSHTMQLEAAFLDAAGRVLSERSFPFAGTTPGFTTDWPKLQFVSNREALLVPAGSTAVRFLFSSGAPGATGTAVLDTLTLNLPGGDLDPSRDLIRNSGFGQLAPDSAAGTAATPQHWHRAGLRPEMAVHLKAAVLGAAIALVDTDPAAEARWTATFPLPADLPSGHTLLLSWHSAWNVEPGLEHTVSWQNVGAGSYELQALAVAVTGGWAGASTSLPIRVQHHLWEYAWFWPALWGAVAALALTAALLYWRQHMRRSMDRLASQHALERDRARIARDMHDDLGARLTRISLLTALADRGLRTGHAEETGGHLRSLAALSREVVSALDEIVWAVAPENDTLDHLGTYLCRFADEFFAGTAVRCRFRIPAVLPVIPLSAEVRHHLYLAVKEALNNILKHAAPCDALLEIRLDPAALVLTVSDTGPGCDPAAGTSGNGLRNLQRRLHDIGGTCTLHSTAAGTTVTLAWPLPPQHRRAPETAR